MIEFESNHDLPYSPAQIWAILGDFDNHRIWNPYVRIERLAEDPVAIRYSMRMDPQKPKFLEVPATIISARDGEELILDVRPSFVLHFEESYVLTPTPEGTKFVHRYRCRGPLAWLRLPGIRTSFQRMLSSIDGVLLSYLTSKYRKPQSPASSPRRPKSRFGGGRR